MAGKKLAAFALIAMAVGASMGVGLWLGSRVHMVNTTGCLQGHCSYQVTEQLTFLTGYDATCDGFRFVVDNAGMHAMTVDSLYVNGTRTQFSISPATSESHCANASATIDVGDYCLVTAGYSGQPSGTQEVKVVAGDGGMFTGFLSPGPLQFQPTSGNQPG